MDFQRLAILVFAAAGLIPPKSFGQGILIPSLTNQAMVFDHSGHLYFSNTDGWIRRFNVFTKQIDAQYELGEPLNGLDISPDDSFLLVGSGNPNVVGPAHAFYKVDLNNGSITGISSRAEAGGDGWDVAIASNDTAIVTIYNFGWSTLGSAVPSRSYL